MDHTIFLYGLGDLIVVVVLAAFVYYFFSNTKVYGIAYYTKVWLLIPGLGITCLFFFSVGDYFSVNRKNLVTEFNKNKIFWLGIMVPSMILTTYFDNTGLKDLFYPIFTISGVVSVIIIVSQLLKK